MNTIPFLQERTSITLKFLAPFLALLFVAATARCGTDAPVIISPLSIFGNINRELVYQIVATGDAQSYDAANLPAGLTLDPVLGIISGIPVVGGTTNVTITAANGQSMDVKTLRLTIFDPSLFPPLRSLRTLEALPRGPGSPLYLTSSRVAWTQVEW